ncbi:MAG TPA: phosphorylase, partial [Novosphingobium sp.]|nr:phosphorylase [Novosphingobium sp.]
PATCDEAWARALAARLPAARLGAIHADGTLIASADDKLAIANASAALAVDMESHIAARAAAEAGLPFAILRCVSDDAHAELPPAIRLAMRPDGALAVGAMLGSVLRQPGQVPALTRTLAGFAGAFRELAQGAQKVGPGLAFEER